MNILKKIAGGLAVAAVLAIQPVRDTQAAPVLNEENFDYDWYLEQHPDVAAALGDNKEAVWAFYMTTGEPAGWYGRVSENWLVTKNFDAQMYANENPDVVQVYGSTNGSALLEHYLTQGRAEGRRAPTSVPVTQIYDAVDGTVQAGMSDREKVTAIHDWVCNHTTYDYAGYYAGNIPDSSYSVSGFFETGRSVCSGYARTMQALLDASGIQNEYVSGNVKNGVSGGAAGHAWNKVYVDGGWLYVDATWDDWDKYNYVGHDCCLVSEERMDEIHNGNVKAWVQQDGTIRYY